MGKTRKLKDEEITKLIGNAMGARTRSYAPYSGYCVGAALLAGEEKLRVYPGSNVENASYGATICAERSAFLSAVQHGQRAFHAIAIVGGKQGEDISDYAFPCGMCRQVMQEFCLPDFQIIVAKSEREYEVHTLAELLPFGFGGDNLI